MAILEGALCVVAAMALSRISLHDVIRGDTVNLELVPLIVFAWRRGPIWGCVAGALGGIGSGLLGSVVLNPVQAFLNYPLTYACTGLTSLFRPSSKEGYVLGLYMAATCSLLCRVTSDALFCAARTLDGIHPLAYALFINGSFMIPKYVLSGIAAWILLM